MNKLAGWVALLAVGYSAMLAVVLWLQPSAQERFAESALEQAQAAFPELAFSESVSSQKLRARHPSQFQLMLEADFSPEEYARLEPELSRRLARIGYVTSAPVVGARRVDAEVVRRDGSRVKTVLWSGEHPQLVLSFGRR